MKINDPSATPDFYQRMYSYFERHLDILRRLQSDSVERAMRFLILTNGGGLIAILSFMGAAESVRDNPTSWRVAGLFLLGVVLCGALAAENYHVASKTMDTWIKDMDAALRAEIDVEQPMANLNAALRYRKWIAPILGYLAFSAFIAGGVTALCVLPPHAAVSAAATAAPAIILAPHSVAATPHK
jgi:hypothetical protein